MKIHCSILALATTAGLCLAAAGAHAAPRTSGNPATDAKSHLSAVQLEEVQARTELAGEIVRNVSADAQAKGLDDSWRVNLLSMLYGTPSGALREIRAGAKTLSEAHTQAAEARSHKAAAPAGRTSPDGTVAAGLGDPFDSLVFNPMTPCRFIDTRVAGGPIGATPRSFDTARPGPTYGGSAGCLLPGIGAPAIAANVTIANPSVAAGYLSVHPLNDTHITSWLNWYQITEVTANAGIVATSINDASHFGFEILASGGSAHVILDFFGYFSASPPSPMVCERGSFDVLTLPPGFNEVHFLTSVCKPGFSAVSVNCTSAGSTDVFLTGVGVTNGNQWCAWENRSRTVISSVTQSVNCCLAN